MLDLLRWNIVERNYFFEVGALENMPFPHRPFPQSPMRLNSELTYQDQPPL
jgi:hypothetical protein